MHVLIIVNLKRNATPSKIRAQSRVRYIATPGRATAATGPATTPAVIRNASPAPARPIRATTQETAPFVMKSRVPFTSGDGPETEVPVASVDSYPEDIMPPLSHSKPRRLSQMDIEIEKRNKETQDIEYVWKTVDPVTEGDAAAIPATFLSKMNFHSPLEKKGEDYEDDDEYLSCAGDLGAADPITGEVQDSAEGAADEVGSVIDRATADEDPQSATKTDIPITSFTSPERLSYAANRRKVSTNSSAKKGNIVVHFISTNDD
jgi:hypothetical protein